MPRLVHDDLDDRREMHRLLGMLPPDLRVGFVAGCCRRSNVPNSGWRPRVAASTQTLAEHARIASDADAKLTQDLYFDVWSLTAQYELDMDDALIRLERLVRDYTAGRLRRRR